MTPSLNTILVGRYRLGRELGRGAHSTVYLAEDLGRGGEQVALKLTRSEKEGYAFFEPAAEVLHWFRHPNWADVRDAGVIPPTRPTDPTDAERANPPRLPNDTWFQAQRYIQGRSLEKLEGPQPIELVLRFLEDGARVLQAIHDRGLIHYDVTPSNFILEDTKDGPRFVLTDGALAHEGPVRGHGRGTALFMAPEVSESGTHDHRIDLYSLGLIAYRLLTGEDALAQEGDDPAEVVNRRRREPAARPSSTRSGIPEALDAVVTALLDSEPSTRPPSGRALLRTLASVVGGSLPEVTSAEAMARAEHGPIVGQDAAINRFTTECSRLAYGYRSPVRGTPGSPTIVVTGDPGSGRSRLLLELEYVSRRHELPVLWVSGESGEASADAPLELLAAGMRSLIGAPEDSAEWTRARYRAHRIESFLALALEVAAATPYVLVVEDYALLGPLAREMLAALARDLQGRYEHRVDSRPRMILAIDAGGDPTDALTIPDAEDPTAPLLPVEPLNTRTLGKFLDARYPGSTLDAQGADRLVAHIDGSPAALISVLSRGFEAVASEGRRRPGLRVEGGTWSVDEDALLLLPTTTELPPALAKALSEAPPDLTRLLVSLSLLKADLDVASARKILGLTENAELPRGVLLTWKTRGGRLFVGLARRAIGTKLRAATPASALDRARQAVLATLRESPTPENRADRIILNAELGQHDEALTAFAKEEPAPPQDVARLLLPTLRQCASASKALPKDHELRAGLASRLALGEGAHHVARVLEPLCMQTDARSGTTLTVAAFLEHAGCVDDALDCISRASDLKELPPRVLLNLLLDKARIALACRRREQAKGILQEMKEDIRALRGLHEPEAKRLCALFLSISARLVFTERSNDAVTRLEEAKDLARGCGDTRLQARIINNLGIAYEQCGQQHLAIRAMRQSRRLKRVLGDLAGEVASTFNLARIYHRAGRLDLAVSHAERSIRLAQRHRLDRWRVAGLRELARAHDAARRPDLAYPVLQRAWRSLQATPTAPELAQVALHLAPLASSFGDLAFCSSVLLSSAQSVRSTRVERRRSSPAAWVAWKTHQLTVAEAMLCSGNRPGFVLALNKLLRRAGPCQSRPCSPEAPKLSRLFSPSEREELNRLSVLASTFSGRAYRPLEESHEPDLRRPGLPALLATVAWHREVRSGGRSALTLDESYGASSPWHAALRHGEIARLSAEFILSACWLADFDGRDSALDALEGYAKSSGFRMLLGRVLLSRAAIEDLEGGQHGALSFSRGVELLEGISGGTLRTTSALPHEARAGVKTLRNAFDISARAPLTTSELHSVAHKLILRKGGGASSDSRLADALRRTLEASAKVRAGATLQELLAMLTRHTIDITGAQRAYVLVFGEDSTEKVGESTWRNDEGAPVDQDRLVTSAIEQVIQTRAICWDFAPTESWGGSGSANPSEVPASLTALGLTSVLCVPILRGPALVGVLYADTRSKAFAFDRVAREVLLLFAEQAGAAIETQRLVEDIQQKMRDLQRMQEKLMHGERLRVIGELSSGVAHEFNNHLQTMLARIHSMQLNDLGDRATGDLRLIQRSAEDAAEIVRRLQGHSRQQRQWNHKQQKAGEICMEALDLLRPLWRASGGPEGGGVRVELRAEDNLWVRGNGTELREVITNLVKNALDAIGSRGSIQVSARREQGRIRIRVEDDGPGIPAEILDQVGEAFFTTKGERGTGLGLCLSRQIVDRHGGSLEVSSEEGRGTVVHVDLPAVGGGSTRPSARQSTSGRQAPPQRGTGTLRVLVVDDEADVRSSVVEYLRRTGHTVVGAASGAEALDAAQEHAFDVVLSDVSMPVMDGLTLCRRLREAHPGLPVVLMSGRADARGLDGADACGAASVLTKPLQFANLAVTLAEFVTL